MKTIKILGENTESIISLFNEAATAKGVEVKLEKITDNAEIEVYGVTQTPGVVIDESVVHSGSVPSLDSVNTWLDASSRNSGCCGGCS